VTLRHQETHYQPKTMTKRRETDLLPRRHFVKQAAVVAATFMIVPRHVLGKGYLAPSDKINLGFIGCGKQSGGLRNSLLKTEQTQVVAAADVDKVKLNHFVETYQKYHTENSLPTPKAFQLFGDFREILARKDVDAVVIAAPDHWHAVMAVKACEAGKDVYCEKPLALTVAEGRAMVNATRKHNRVLQTGSMQRSWSEFRQAVELVRNGYVGAIKEVRVNVGGPPKGWDLPAEPTPEGMNWDFWLGPNMTARPYNNNIAPPIEAKFWPKWREYAEFGGGGMTDWGAHMFDIAQWGLDMDHSGPVEFKPPTDRSGNGLVMTYANGIKLIHETVDGKPHCRFIGTEGEIMVVRGELTTTPASLKDKVIGEGEKRVYNSPNHYLDFVNAIRSRQKPICDVEVGHRTASLCNVGNIAYALGRPLKWNPQTEQFTNDAEANALLTRPMRKEWAIG
jgi:predicted dehydrogenase